MMIKKRHLMILSVAIVSVLVGSLVYNNMALAGKPIPQPEKVEVINFPIDEEGNLRVTQMDGEQNVTVTNFPTDLNINIVHHTLNVTFATEKTIGTQWHFFKQNVSEYKQVTVGMKCIAGEPRFEIDWIIGGVDYVDCQIDLLAGKSTFRTYEVQFETMCIGVKSMVGSSIISLGLYATN